MTRSRRRSGRRRPGLFDRGSVSLVGQNWRPVLGIALPSDPAHQLSPFGKKEKRRMIATRLPIRVAATLAILRATSAFADEGRPIVASDVAGKKVCWNTGQWDMYEADGQFTNNYGRHSKWSVPEPGVLKRGPQDRQGEGLPDGRFHLHYSQYGAHRNYWG